MIEDKQVQKYRKLVSSGRKTREQAAAAAGMSAKTARKWEVGPMPSEVKVRSGPRTWRTRKDEFADPWETLILPELNADEDGVFEAKFLFEYLQDERPGQFPDSMLRTFQRRVTDYRALQGPPKEVFFPQVHRPGEKAQLDFTRLGSLSITVQGQPLDRMLFECILCYSGRRFVMVVPSESYEALTAGVKGAFLAWDGVPAELWHDHLSAAIRSLKNEDRYEINQRYKDLLGQYGVVPRFIEVAKPNQNGCVERGHQTLKGLIGQALKLRRSSDFQSGEHFVDFITGLVERLNRRKSERWPADQAALKALPRTLPSTYSELRVAVSRWSLVQIRNNTYSVPSRLIGHSVLVRIQLETLEVYYKDKLVETMPRLRGRNQTSINYRHIIRSLVRKPGAFASYRYREQMFPTLTFRRAYDHLVLTKPANADKEYLRILKLAADTMESDVEMGLELHLDAKLDFGHQVIAELIRTRNQPVILSAPATVDLSSFNELLTGELRDQLAAA